MSALVGAFQTANNAQSGGFAAAGRAQQYQGFTGINLQVKRLERRVATSKGAAALV
ncbi:hypothetical protein HSBAA_38540 [Vreelandella sulfidaeris]|uniref:Uncharacterized protein n=1 Tax=Vreelandella sulfidaeris TaxID=115553 RepID=A0A455UDY3_9GAMM|nr:hypothetical protein HSBAA_38540 [Halomonas sulfidaeris]